MSIQSHASVINLIVILVARNNPSIIIAHTQLWGTISAQHQYNLIVRSPT